MDAFYASVEQRDNPGLQGRAVAVGGSPNGRGVVMTASYEARVYGVRSAMPSKRAIQLCPHLIFVRPRFDAYKAASRIIRDVFYSWTDLVEPLSLDEAFLDVTENKHDLWSALLAARRIKDEIRAQTGLTATAGVSYCKFLAKMASGHKKPDGLNWIPEDRAQEYIDALPVHKFHGIGKKTAERMEKLGIQTGADLRTAELKLLHRHFGKMGRFYHKIANGIDERSVNPHRPMKSASAEDTFPEDLDDLKAIDEHIERLCVVLLNRLEKREVYGRTVNLKVKFADFKIVTRSQSFPEPVTQFDTFAKSAKALLRKTEAGQRKVRLIGVGMSNFDLEGPTRKKGGQLELDL